MDVIITEPMDLQSSNAGGMKSYVLNIIPYLMKEGINVTLIGVSKNKITIKTDYRFIPIVEKDKISGYDYLISLLLRVKFLGIKDSSIIHAQRPDNMFPFVIFYKKNPKLCTLHGDMYEAIKYKKGRIVSWFYGFLEKFTLKRVDKIIVVSEGTRDYYIKKYPWLRDKITVIPVGVDINKFKLMNRRKMREKYGFNENDKIVLYVGRLEKEKRLSFLIRSFKEVNDAKLILVGNGREKEKLENLTKELKLDDVVFTGTLEHNKIPEIMNCADVFVLTSLYESGPLVTQEALACGVPVVSVDVGRVRDFIQNGLVGKIADRNEKDFANAITLFLEKKDRKAIEKACREIAMDFSFEKTANKTIEVYKILNTISNKNEK